MVDIFERDKDSSIKRKILFEYGKWCIYKRPNPSWNKFGEMVLIIHRCSNVRWNNAIHFNSTVNDCAVCSNRIPDEVRTVYTLYNWEKYSK